MKPFIKVMKALSDPSRVKIIKMLHYRRMCVCEIQAALGIAQSTASSHLKILEDAGLTSYEKEGLWVNYTLAENPGSEYALAMLAHIEKWLDDDPEIAHLIERLPDIRRENICRR